MSVEEVLGIFQDNREFSKETHIEQTMMKQPIDPIEKKLNMK